MKLDRSTIIKYLKQGAKIGWCDYDPKLAQVENGKRKKNKFNIKPVVRLDLDGTYIDKFESIKEAARKLQIYPNGIVNVCNKNRESIHGFKFMFESDYNYTKFKRS